MLVDGEILILKIEVTKVCECFIHEIHIYIFIYINYLYHNIIYYIFY